jgi:uncharacterized protein (TIGR03382 family)
MRSPSTILVASSAVAVAVGLIALPGPSAAYTVSSLVTPGCHERLTSEALRTVRRDVAAAAPMSRSANEQALINDLQFTPDSDMTDLGGATLLIGVRDNDLKGRSSADTTYLGAVHGDPNNQDEHCLRSAGQDEPGGTESALIACRAFIRDRVAQALDGLDASGFPDTTRRTSLPVYLALRGRVHASLPTYYLRMGQALHALEDTFTHTYRTADSMKVTVALNWIDEAAGTLVESRDGPRHVSELDRCDDADALRTARRALAVEASVALLRETLTPARTKEQKLTATDMILDQYLGYAPGCTFDNGWCNAPERQYKNASQTGLGCSSTGGAGLTAGAVALLALTLLRRRRRPTASALAALLVVGGLTFPLNSASAQAEAKTPATEATEAAKVAKTEPGAPNGPPVAVTVPVVQPGPRDPAEGAWGAEFSLSGSVNKPALAVQAGIRRRLSSHWTLGLDAEWNSWVSLYGPTNIRAGVANAYFTAILRFPLAYENFNLRTTANLGISYLLVDLYGAPKGSLGLYAALYPLGIEYKLSRTFLLIVNPLGIAVPVPMLTGVPLSYPQYRVNVGIGIMNG